MTPALLADISRAIAGASGEAFRVSSLVDVAGGCINRGLTLSGDDGRRFFVKLNQPVHLAMFEAEAAGLAELHNAQAIRVPRPVAHGLAGDQSFLAMEWLDLSRQGEHRLLGEQLARLHRHTRPAFGWFRDNTIGSTPQMNAEMDDWVGFYRERRLRPQLDLAARRGAGKALIEPGERLLADLAGFFPGYLPRPSLLHGDMWSGNASFSEGLPVIFDPAVYYGDRETDIAMTELFGGFPKDFYSAYRAAWPLDPGYPSRKNLYQLYHLLNHFNLFGGGYGNQTQSVIARLLAELR